MNKNLLAIVFLFGLAASAYAQVDEIAKKHDSNQPIKITSDNLEVLQNDHVAIFTGNVIAVQGEVTLKSETMKVHYRGNDSAAPGAPKPVAKAPSAGANPANSSSISLIEVEKNVFMTAPNESAEGNNGTYNVDDHLIKLNGQVVLVKDKNIVKGDRLEYNLDTGKSEIFSDTANKSKPGGRVESVFVPNKKNNSEPENNQPKTEKQNGAE